MGSAVLAREEGRVIATMAGSPTIPKG